MDSPQQQAGLVDRFRSFAGWTAFVARSWAVTVEVFLHRRFGERYIGLQAVAAIPLVLLYTLFWNGHDLRPMFVFLAAYLALCLAARIGVALRRRRGPQLHSYYTGQPRLMRVLPRLSEFAIKRAVEPALLLVAGALTRAANKPLGTYLMLAAAALVITATLAAECERRQGLDLYDSYVDQRQASERFRRLRGDRFPQRGRNHE